MPAPPITSRAAFAERRDRLIEALQKRQVRAAALPSGFARPRNFAHNVFPFRAESHFLYFIGRHIEGAIFAIEDGEARLYVLEPDRDEALWHGPALPPDALGEELGLTVLPLDSFQPLEGVATLPPQDEETSEWLAVLLDRPVEAQGGPHLEGVDELFAEALVELRLIHDGAALQQLAYAAEQSAGAHVRGMTRTPSAQFEFEVRGAMEGALVEAGLTPAYTSIVSVRGEVLHNPISRGRLSEGVLLLADVGGETLEGFAGDITRTWPSRGRFNEGARDVYELVLSVQERSILRVRPGASFLDLHRATTLDIAEGLVQLGILRGRPTELIERGAVALFFPHGLGHLLGLDVHDMEDLGDRSGYAPETRRSGHPSERALRLNRVLEANMVVTIEPGIYFSPLLLERGRLDPMTRESVNWGLVERLRPLGGVRIEDDVRVSDGEPVVLSAAAPKTIEAIEALLG